MRGGNLVYKCRRCGKLIKNTHVPDCLSAITCMVVNGETPNSWIGPSAKMTGTHVCDDDNYGITDLIGAEEDK